MTFDGILGEECLFRHIGLLRGLHHFTESYFHYFSQVHTIPRNFPGIQIRCSDYIIVIYLCPRYRMPSSQVYFYKSSYHRNHYVLTLAFCFDKEEEAYQFAYSYPYSYSKCQAYLEQIERKMLPHFQRNELTRSLVISCVIHDIRWLKSAVLSLWRRYDCCKARTAHRHSFNHKSLQIANM